MDDGFVAAGVGEGQMMKGSTKSTKRKADVAVAPTSEDVCITKRKVDELADGFMKVKKPADAMAIDGCDDDDWVSTPLDENGELIIDKELHAGVDENGDLIMDKELLEHLEWVKTLEILHPRNVPGVTVWSDVDGDESEE